MKDENGVRIKYLGFGWWDLLIAAAIGVFLGGALFYEVGYQAGAGRPFGGK